MHTGLNHTIEIIDPQFLQWCYSYLDDDEYNFQFSDYSTYVVPRLQIIIEYNRPRCGNW